MDKVTTVGIDLAKRIFALHGVDASGQVALRKTVRRDAVIASDPLPVLARQAIEDLRAHLTQLDERIGAYDRQLEQQARLVRVHASQYARDLFGRIARVQPCSKFNWIIVRSSQLKCS